MEEGEEAEEEENQGGRVRNHTPREVIALAVLDWQAIDKW